MIEDLHSVVQSCFSWSTLYREVHGKRASGNSLAKFREEFKDSIDTEHFTGNGKPKTVLIAKVCPVCDKDFMSQPRSNETVTCSYSFSNTYFRSGADNPNYKASPHYRTTCFMYHDKVCVVCGEYNIVEVHHVDEDRGNDSPDNLVPLCPTHHQYWHSRYKYLVEDKVYNYLEEKFRKGKPKDSG